MWNWETSNCTVAYSYYDPYQYRNSAIRTKVSGVKAYSLNSASFIWKPPLRITEALLWNKIEKIKSLFSPYYGRSFSEKGWQRQDKKDNSDRLSARLHYYCFSAIKERSCSRRHRLSRFLLNNVWILWRRSLPTALNLKHLVYSIRYIFSILNWLIAKAR